MKKILRNLHRGKTPFRSIPKCLLQNKEKDFSGFYSAGPERFLESGLLAYQLINDYFQMMSPTN